jgi:hypothetical protein
MARLPTLPEVTYAAPNPEGSRKACRNCVFFATADQACLIFAKDVTVKPTMVCGYHVPGSPGKDWIKLPLDPQDPKMAGMIPTKDGTSCDLCTYYDVGRCRGVSGPNKVQAKGCCTRWSQKADPSLG